MAGPLAPLARAALIAHGTPQIAATALIGAAVEVLSDVISDAEVWDAIGVVIEVAEHEWRQRHAN